VGRHSKKGLRFGVKILTKLDIWGDYQNSTDGSYSLLHLWSECIHPVCSGALRHFDPRCRAFDRSKIPPEKVADAKNAEKEPWVKTYLHNTQQIGKMLKDLNVGNPFQVSQSVSRVQECELAFTRAKRTELIPECTSKFKMAMGRCTTCCCKEGLTNLQISHSLVQGKLIKCGVWFGALDALLRSLMSLYRAGMVIQQFAGRCFQSCAVRPTERECTKSKLLRGQAYGCVWLPHKGPNGKGICKNRDWEAMEKQQDCTKQ